METLRKHPAILWLGLISGIFGIYEVYRYHVKGLK